MSAQLLQGKHAVVFGAGGSVGAATAKEFAAEGAEVFLAGRTKNVQSVADQIMAGEARRMQRWSMHSTKRQSPRMSMASRTRPAGSTSCSTPSAPDRRTTATGRTSSI